MENVILQTRSIVKSYGHFKALDNISITLQKGHIYGFIGENGAGKTTLMRILTGLSLPTAGSYSLFERENHKGMQHIRKRIGSTIEEPALYPDFSAYRNMELQRILIGNPDKSTCDELLKLLDLYDVRDKKVRNFSMGMKQRLSIALTLVGKPELLILDEPINGLDPKNISSLRTLLKKLNEERGITMLISSHILNELYLLATDYIIIHKGKIMESLSHEELEAKCENYVKVCTDSLPQCITVIEKELGILDYKVIDDNTLHIYAYTKEPQKISQALTRNNIVIGELSVCGQSLEEYFLSLTGGRRND
ncbi:MAG: ABC transporter ATP-binding protein [Butyrivibrio sp.]|nr:ABC transporter ATP-binding protein [Acetatifactor muris]MCM1558105.1 ABC transporter ATP-binding protein [Butyrivibrio sp.]MCM1560468.1 ABC transporter ATP-binding protein [Butyrivibrio sp.]